MNYEERQAQLLDDYLTALQENPHAPVPDGLEPDMAEFARMFLTEQETEESSPAKYRVWQEIHATQNKTIQERDTYMAKLKEKNKRSGKFSGWMPMTAVAILTIVIGIGAIGVVIQSNGKIMDDAEVPPHIALTATAIIEEATAQTTGQFFFTSTPSPTVAATATFPPTPILPPLVPPDGFPTPSPFPFMPQQSDNPLLECDFEGELAFQISQNTINETDTLLIWGAALNSQTENMVLEIFGGFITNDEFQNIMTFSPPPFQEVLLAQIQGTAYAPGSYLIQIRLRDRNGETLSSCGLPVTFTGE